MKLTTLLCFTVTILCYIISLAHSQELTICDGDRQEDIDIANESLQNKEFVKEQLDCIQDKGPCSDLGTIVKSMYTFQKKS